MYKNFFLIVFLLLFSFSCIKRQEETNSSKASSPEVAEDHPQASTSVVPAVEEVIFINADTVLVFPGFLSGIVDEEAINRDRVPLITQDGGESWDRFSSKTISFNSINFLNVSQGWLINLDSELWRTTDGGVSWIFVSKIEDGKKNLDHSQQISFIDELNGWILGLDSLWQTEDGGKTWLRNEFPWYVTKSFFRGKTAWVASRNNPSSNVIYRRQGNGESWEEIEVPNTKSKRLLDGVDIEDLFFVDEKRGWLANTRSIYRTDDGGKSWQKQRLPGRKIWIKSLCFISDLEGWAAGWKAVGEKEQEFAEKTEAILLHTTNGGDVWQQVDVEVKQISFDRVYFGDSQNGWLVAVETGSDEAFRNANIYRTRDGGVSWKKVLSIKSPYESE